MKLKPRDYQAQGLEDIRAAISGRPCERVTFRVGHSGRCRLVVYVLPTGGGKTAVYAWIAEGAATKNNNVLILEHRKELIKQASVALARLGLRHQIVAPDAKKVAIRKEHVKELGRPYLDEHSHVAVASVQTLARRMEWLQEFKPALIICDEAHHAIAGTWARIYEATRYAVQLGVTATPCRTNGQGLREVYEGMVLGPSMAELIADGYLVPSKVFAPPLGAEGLDNVGTKGGDIDLEKMAEFMATSTITGSAVSHYASHCPGASAIVFCCNRAHAKQVAAQFQAAGWRFFVIDGTLDDTERDRLINGLQDGSVQGLVSVDLISEGTDIPKAEAAFMLRRTLSESLYLQMAGRVLRPIYGKGYDLSTLDGRLEAITASGKTHGLIFDHVGNYLRHGKPQDERGWTLEGRRVRRRAFSDPEEALDISQCPKCYHVHEKAPTCPECGHVYEPLGTSGPKHLDGELAEVGETAEEIERREARREQGRLRTIEQMQRAGISTGRAAHILAARQEKERLQAELLELVAHAGAGPSRTEVMAMKPKQLREAIEIAGGELFMGVAKNGS